MGNESHDFLTDPAQEPPQAGPSWARSNWPRVGGEAEDDLTRALDPTAMLAAVKQAAKQAGAPILTLTYMATEDVSFELYAGLPYQHDIEGDGSIKGVGKIASVKQVSPTLFAQYRFFDKNAMVRPYVGLGLTYAYFYGEEGSGTLTALTNPGSGQATLLEIDDAWGLSPQLGASVKIDRNWFVDIAVIKSFIKAKSHLSTGQSIEAKLDPMAYNLSVGYRF